jgi:transposase-like protein
MARTAQKPEFWAAVVAEARTGELALVEVAAKHGVSVAALKYHLYKGKRSATKQAPTPRVLPVRLKSERSVAVVEAELGSVRVNFREGCDPAYVAAVLGALAKC